MNSLMNKVLLGAVGLLLLIISCGSGYWAWTKHRESLQAKIELQSEKEDRARIGKEKAVAVNAMFDELERYDLHNNQLMGELDAYVKGNPGLDLYLMSRQPDDACRWMLEYYQNSNKEGFPTGYIPTTCKKANTVGGRDGGDNK